MSTLMANHMTLNETSQVVSRPFPSSNRSARATTNGATAEARRA